MSVAFAAVAHAQYSATVLPSPGFTASYGQATDQGQSVGYGATMADGSEHAFLWNGTTFQDITPPEYLSAEAVAVSNGLEVGWGINSAFTGPFGFYGPANHALVWYGNSAEALDINPDNWTTSQALAISNHTVVGFVENQSVSTLSGWPLMLGISSSHAFVWTGVGGGPFSQTDLNPLGMTGSVAVGVDSSAGSQVGYAWGPQTNKNNHAFLWHGRVAQTVDLNGFNLTQSEAFAVSGNQQVGYGSGTSTGNAEHAFLWKGSPSSGVDLNPSNFQASRALGVSNSVQVGFGSPTGQPNVDHALAWNGSAASARDLQRFLPESLVGSKATGVDKNGNIVGRAWDARGTQYAVIWQPGNVSDKK